MRQMRRVLALRPADRVLLARAFVHVAAIRLSLCVLPFRLFRGALGTQCDPRSSLASLATPRSDSSSESTREAQVERLVWAVRTAARFVPRASCLTQALALHRLLQGAGQASVLNIGIAREAEEIRSHAWIEHDGHCWLTTSAEAGRFTALASWRRGAS